MSAMIARIHAALVLEMEKIGPRKHLDCLTKDEEMALVRAMLDAMREATCEMVEAGGERFFAWSESGVQLTVEQLAERIWSAVIDADLGEGG